MVCIVRVERHKVEKWSGRVGDRWVWWVWWVMSGSVDSQCHELSKIVWFVWRSNSVEIHGGVTNAGQQTREDSATQLVICETLTLLICFNSYIIII